MWSECKCSCNLKRAECFSRARVCHSATVFLRLPGARQWQHQLFLSSCWSEYAKPQMEGSSFAFCFLHKCCGHQAGCCGPEQALPAHQQHRVVPSLGLGRLRPRTPPHHPLLGCLSPAKNNSLAEKSSNGRHFLYPLQDEKHPSILPIPCIISF